MNIDGKSILSHFEIDSIDVIKNFPKEYIADDIKTIITELYII
jgi:hypothetical protein